MSQVNVSSKWEKGDIQISFWMYKTMFWIRYALNWWTGPCYKCTLDSILEDACWNVNESVLHLNRAERLRFYTLEFNYIFGKKLVMLGGSKWNGKKWCWKFRAEVGNSVYPTSLLILNLSATTFQVHFNSPTSAKTFQLQRIFPTSAKLFNLKRKFLTSLSTFQLQRKCSNTEFSLFIAEIWMHTLEFN